jgi:hypothetical protein
MGLDMYLSAKRYISKHFNEGDTERAEAIQKLFPELEGMTGKFGDASPVKEVSIDAGYWRKANAIHDWFVREVQGGEDECKPHYVSRDQLQQLKESCEEVLIKKDKAPELLPTTNGFFFGSTDYDQYYFEDLTATVEIVDRCLAMPTSWEFEYRSSW